MCTKLNNLASLSDYITVRETTENNEQVKQPAVLNTEYKNPTYNIVSIMAYLIGVEKKFFTNEQGTPKLETYEQLNKDKSCRIIRNLCLIRSFIERNYMHIVKTFRDDIRNIGSIPEYVPSEAVSGLAADGITLFRSRPDIDQYLIQINSELRNRIETVSVFFPEWIEWEYIKPLFLMENGTKPQGLKTAGYEYNGNRDRYPYRAWLNWNAISVSPEAKGNILYNDEKFVTMLYTRNEDRFTNLSLIRDVGDNTMQNFNDLLDARRKCIIVVDCENSDVVKLAAALSSLNGERLSKIGKILLFDSEYTTPEWKTYVDRDLHMVCSAEIEHIIVQRLNQSKSQVDMTLAVRASREVFINGVDGVILFSSDSDYWAMINQLDTASFLVMLEKRKTGSAIVDALMNHEIPYCFIDEFCTAASYGIKTATLNELVQERLDRAIGDLNLKDMMSDILEESWISMTMRERDAYYDRYLKKLRLTVAPDGSVSLKLDT